MAQDWARPFYNSRVWIKCRNAYVQTQYGVCERCGMPGDEVHHKIHLTPTNINNPEITLGWDNLELLCSACHRRAHGEEVGAVREGLVFTEAGELVEVQTLQQDFDR